MASTPAPDTIDRIVLEKGWATPEQIRAAKKFQAQRKAAGEEVTLAQAFVALGILTEVQVRRAIGGPKAPPPPSTGPHPLADAIKGYRIIDLLGSGGMGDVYLARQISLDRNVAIKILPPHFATNEEFIERFVKEARAAGKLNHENIVAGVDVGESNGRFFYVMEYVEGPTIRQLLKKEGPLEEPRALDIARQVCRGLKHAHRLGLIHRDIKPGNIMLNDEGVAKICDFGLARRVHSAAEDAPGQVQSSPAYTAPEICRGMKDIDHRADMYSLGITLFEMFTGERPFHADSSSRLFVKHATVIPPSPQEIRPDLSPAATQLVLRLLKKDPKHRFETYDLLIEAIDACEKPKSPPGR